LFLDSVVLLEEILNLGNICSSQCLNLYNTHTHKHTAVFYAAQVPNKQYVVTSM